MTGKAAHEYIRKSVEGLERSLEGLEWEIRNIRQYLHQLRLSADDVQTLEEGVPCRCGHPEGSHEGRCWTGHDDGETCDCDGAYTPATEAT